MCGWPSPHTTCSQLPEPNGISCPSNRHEVRPGITGWAQCHGRNAISWAEKFRLDVWYVDHVSLKTDLTVILTSIKTVFHRDGISQAGSATMEPFNGNN